MSISLLRDQYECSRAHKVCKVPERGMLDEILSAFQFLLALLGQSLLLWQLRGLESLRWAGHRWGRYRSVDVAALRVGGI